MSRATTIVPVSEQARLDRILREQRADLVHRAVEVDAHDRRRRASRPWLRAGISPGSVSSCSRKMPSGVIFALIWRSALQETPMPTGRLAPCRGRRITRTSWQKYLPPNCAPMPSWRVNASTSCSISRSRMAWPARLPSVGRRVEPAGGGELHRLEGELGAGAADDDGEVVGRAGGGAERSHLAPRGRRAASPG